MCFAMFVVFAILNTKGVCTPERVASVLNHVSACTHLDFLVKIHNSNFYINSSNRTKAGLVSFFLSFSLFILIYVIYVCLFVCTSAYLFSYVFLLFLFLYLHPLGLSVSFHAVFV